MLDIFFFDQNGLAIKKRIKILLMCVTGFNLPLCIPTLCGPIQKSLIDKIFFEKKSQAWNSTTVANAKPLKFFKNWKAVLVVTWVRSRGTQKIHQLCWVIPTVQLDAGSVHVLKNNFQKYFNTKQTKVLKREVGPKRYNGKGVGDEWQLLSKPKIWM